MSLTPVLPEQRDQLVVADSFRVRGSAHLAKVRGWWLHLARFETAVRAAVGERDVLETIPSFLQEATAAIRAAGESFPRLECWRAEYTGKHRLSVNIRPLPQLTDTVHAVPTRNVVLDHPERKGPNLQKLTALNALLGGEAVLVHANRSLSEGASTSLVWWENGTLCVSDRTDRVPSVTEALILAQAAAEGFPTAARGLTEAMLHTHEVWAVNALHGIRPVTHVLGEAGELTGGAYAARGGSSRSRLAQFRRLLDECWEPVRPESPLPSVSEGDVDSETGTLSGHQ